MPVAATGKLPLIILGKAPVKGKKGVSARDDWPGCEVWTVGTARIAGADRYYEFHGLECQNRNVYRAVSADIKKAFGLLLPFNNSICAMIMEAYLEGYRNIRIAGCPMTTKAEYIEQARAVAMCVGFIRGLAYGQPYRGLRITWDEEPKKEFYYEVHQSGY